VRRVIIDDALGLGDDFDADIARHVESYSCEWADTLKDPRRLAHFEIVQPPAELVAQSADSGWVPVGPISRFPINRGRTVRIDHRELAVFRLNDSDAVAAIGNVDPFSGASVLARGIVGDANGTVKVASPMFKHSFALDSGVSLEDPAISVPRFDAKIVDDLVLIHLPDRSV
jgi:nitrite reductase (NADH) large subunit